MQIWTFSTASMVVWKVLCVDLCEKNSQNYTSRAFSPFMSECIVFVNEEMRSNIGGKAQRKEKVVFEGG